MFDISDATNPTEIDNYLFGDDRYYSSESYDHKAITIDFTRDIIVLPYVYHGNISQTAGFLVMGYSEEDGFYEKANVEFDDIKSSEVLRVIFIDDIFYALRENSLTAVSMEDYSIKGEVSLS